MSYNPYTGGGGPTAEQAEGNTKYLGSKLRNLCIPFEEDRDYAKENWDGDDLMIKVTRPDGQVCYASYDRWGFVSDELELDQDNLITTTQKIYDWYSAE